MTIAIVLAAGKGTRMRSHLPKVAHRLAGVPIILHIHAAIVELGDCTPLYVLGHQHEIVRAMLPAGAATVLQEEQRGTGHAVQVALPALPDDCDEVLVLYGDVPLLASGTLAALRRHHRSSGANLTVLSAEMTIPPDMAAWSEALTARRGRSWSKSGSQPSKRRSGKSIPASM